MNARALARASERESEREHTSIFFFLALSLERRRDRALPPVSPRPHADARARAFLTFQLGVRWEPGPFERGCRIKKFTKTSSRRRGFLELDGRVPVGAVLDSINGHNVKAAKHAKILRFFQRRDVDQFKLCFLVSNANSSGATGVKSRGAASGATTDGVDHQIKSETTGVALHRQPRRTAFKMTIRKWRVSEVRSTSFVEYELVCAVKDSHGIHRWALWKRYSELRKLHRELEKAFGWQFEQCNASFPAKTYLSNITPAFNEARLQGLKEYFGRVLTIPKIAEFDRHHCSAALRDFVEYEAHLKRNGTNTSPRSSTQRSSSRRSLKSMKSGGLGSYNRRSVRRGLRSGTDSPSVSSPSVEDSASSPAVATTSTSNEDDSAPPASVRSDPRFAPFVKMLQMHLPMGAIRHKMVASGFSEDEIESFSSDSASRSATSSSASTIRGDPRFAPFTKMLQMHLPMGAIRHKMIASGFSEDEIEAFASDGGNASPPTRTTTRTTTRTPPPRPSRGRGRGGDDRTIGEALSSRPIPKTRQSAPKMRKAPSAPAAKPGDLLAAIRAGTKLKKRKKPIRKKPKKSKPTGMAAVLQAKLAARAMRLRKHDSSSEVKRAASASANRRSKSGGVSSDSEDDW